MITVEETGQTLMLEIAGETFDAKTAKAARSELHSTLRGHKQVILDLSQLTFVDSSGLGVLIGCLRQVNSDNGELKLCGLTGEVRTLFQLVQMHRLFDIYNTRDEALRAFQGKTPQSKGSS